MLHRIRTWLVLVGIAATLGAVALATGAQAAAPPADPAVGAAQNKYAMNAFWRGADNGLDESWFASNGWNGPIEIAGTAGALASAPATALESNGNLDVYWRGADNGLHEAYWNGTWHGPGEVPGTAGALASAPTAAPDKYAMNVFWRRTDGGLGESWFASNGWNGPIEIAGTAGSLASAPAASLETDGNLDAYWRGADNGLHEAYWNGAWSAPLEVPRTAGLVATDTASPPAGTTAIPLPPPSPGVHRRHLRVRIVFSWRRRGSHTKLLSVRFLHLPRHAAVRMHCHGRGCPITAHAARSRGPAGVRRALRGVVFARGNVLVLTVSAPGAAPEVAEIAFRGRRAPAGRILSR